MISIKLKYGPLEVVKIFLEKPEPGEIISLNSRDGDFFERLGTSCMITDLLEDEDELTAPVVPDTLQ